jgi:hypothetical protein
MDEYDIVVVGGGGGGGGRKNGKEKKKKENPNGHLNAKFVRNHERKIENSGKQK